MNEDQYDGLIQAINDLKETTASGSVATQDKLDHISGQLNVLNHSMYVSNDYASWILISLMLIAAMVMFLVGYLLTRR